jgi:RimJ/RimL family protein N-acetyltransferase
MSVLLRPVTTGDLPILFEHQADEEASRMAAFATRDRASFDAHWNKILGDRTVLARTILFENQVAGNIASFERRATREVGYWIGKSYWGKGIATAALIAFLEVDCARPWRQ